MFDCRDLAGHLICPDDHWMLRFGGDHFACDRCRRNFSVLQGRVLELLPREPAELPGQLSQDYRRAYEEEFRRPFHLNSARLPWGAPEAQPAAWLRQRVREMAAVRPLLGDDENTCRRLLCDVSAGAGLYTFAYAPQFRGVLHCDLCGDSLAYAAARAAHERRDNIVFLRIDYLRPPFAPLLDRVLCLDSLIRGPEHERMLLRAIGAMLKPTGRAIVDFHNWWHNPLRRLGLMRQNFGACRSYSQRQIAELLAGAGTPAVNCFRFLQELEPTQKGWRQLVRRLLPATRFVYTLTPPSRLPCRDVHSLP